MTSSSVVPPGATSAVVCEYSWSQVATTVVGTLSKSSSPITGSSLAQLIEAMNSSAPVTGQTSPTSTTTTNPAEPQVGTAPVETPPEFEVIFSYDSDGMIGFGLSPDSPWGLTLLTPGPATPTEFWVPPAGLVSLVSSFVN
jgi:hypothetical protein